jgi:peroxiredoxin
VPHDPTTLPADLPVPQDDGAADHLPGALVPSVPLAATTGGAVDLAARSTGRRLVVFAYPRTGRPGVDMPSGWDEIPGARGCTPEACSFRDLHGEFTAAGAEVYGLSTQDTGYQQEAASRLGLTYPLLSDASLTLADAVGLPTFEVDGARLLKRLTLVLRDGLVERALYPVFPPDRAAEDALAALREAARTS